MEYDPQAYTNEMINQIGEVVAQLEVKLLEMEGREYRNLGHGFTENFKGSNNNESTI